MWRGAAGVVALILTGAAAAPILAAPANDNFDNASPVHTASGTDAGNNFDATQEAGEPRSPGGGGRTVWWRWTPPAGGCVFVDTAGSSFDTVLCVYRGTALGNLVTVGVCNDDASETLQSRVEFSATAGTAYWIQVDGFSDAVGNIVLNWGADTTPPFNDNFGNAGFLGGVTGSAPGNNCAASAEAGEPSNSGRTVWWRWVAPGPGRFFFRTGGSSFDTLLCAYRGDTVTTLAAVACDDDGDSNNTSRVEFCAEAGVTYSIRVDGANATQGDIVLTWGQASALPPNDNFIQAIPLSGPSGTVGGHNRCATREPGEPGDPRGGGRTVWWCWTAPANGCYFFHTVGSSFDTVMCAYRYGGGGLASLIQVGNCSDDSSGKGVASRVEFKATAGTIYWIQVDGFAANEGDIALNWGPDFTPPSNDSFAMALGLAGAAGTARGNNCNATDENAEDEPVNSGRTVWWRWVAPANVNGCVWFTTSGSDFDTLLCVFTGAALNSLTPVGCVDDGTGKGALSRVEFNATSGTVYWIRVDGFESQSGTIVLNWASGAPANDSFANATVLGNSGSVAGQNRCSIVETGEPVPGGGNHTIWYRWTPAASGCAFVSTRGTGFDTVLSVYTGAAVNGLTLVGSNDDAPGKGFQSRIEFFAQAGVPYSIQVDGYLGAEGDIVLTWGTDITPPPNDNFAAATFLSNLSGNRTGNNCAATIEAGEPQFAGGSRTIWYSWRAVTNTCVFFSTAGSPFDTVLCVFTGANVASLTQVGCNDDGNGKGVASRVEFVAQSNVTYWIQAAGFSSAAGVINLSWGPDTTPPSNDAFVGATTVNGNAGRLTGNNCNATGEAGEPGNSARTVWWRWTAPASGCAWISTRGSGFDTVTCVYTGATVNGLIEMACSDDALGKDLQSRVEFNAWAGATYFIRVDGFKGAYGDIVLQYGYGSQSDSFAGATVLGPFGTLTGHNRCATLEAGEPSPIPGGGHTIWYRWTTPPASCGHYFFSTIGSSFDTYMCIYTGAAVNALTPVACNDNFPGQGAQSRVEFDPAPGTTYSIRVDGFGAAAGDIQFTWGPAGPPPANDDFAAATLLSGASGTTAGGNCTATGQPREPLAPVGGGRTVWYCWTAPVTECVFFNTVGSTFDTVLCAYTGGPVAALNRIGCNDDTVGKEVASRVEFHAQAGQRYWIQVDGFLGSHGGITLNWGSDTSPPVNDAFASATSIEGGQGSIRGNNCNATFEGGTGEPVTIGGGGRTVWYRWTAPNNTRFAFRTLGSSFNTVLCVYTGASLNGLTSVACADDTGGKGAQSRVEFDATAGTVYWIRVDGYFDAAGDIQLSWGCWPRNFRIGRVHNFVLISWDSVGFSLQGTPELRDGGSVWTDIPGASPVLLPATGSARFFRLRCENTVAALPDLVINAAVASPQISTEVFAANSCEVLEGCAIAGTRRLLRFNNETRNIGSANLVLGNPAGNPLFSFAACHGHYHFENFAAYRLRAGNGAVVATGAKVGFCLLDLMRWNPTANATAIYTCVSQGIQAGWADIYSAGLPCQYIDITDVAPGNYTLEMEIDPSHLIPEANEANNIVTVPVAIP
jgi:hypothetical protein